MFGWVPSGESTSCCRISPITAVRPPRAEPRDMLTLDIAPLSHAFETFPASERPVLADEPRGDPPRAGRSRQRPRIDAGGASFWVRSRPGRRTPNRCFIATSRCHATRPRAGMSRAPRCSLRPGWVAAWGGHRAAMTKWCFGRWCATTAHFYDPLGLVSQGTGSISRPGQTRISMARAL